MVKATVGLPLSYAKLEGDSDTDTITLYWWNPATASWEPVIRFKGSTKEIQEIGSIVKSIVVKTTSPYIQLQGTESGARTFQIKEDAGFLKVVNVSTGSAVNLEPILILASASPPLGTSGTLGSAVSITPSTGYSRIVPLGVKITVGGTLDTGESITVRVTFVFSDNSTLYVSKTYTATGDDYLGDADFFTLWKNGVGVARIDVQAASSAASTAATVTVTVRGVQY